MDADKGKALVRTFLETLHGGNVEGALAMTTADAKVMIFNNTLPDGFRMLGGMIPALFDTPPTREYTVISQVTIRGTTKVQELYENYYLIIIRFEGDKVALMQEYIDSAYANQKFAFAQQG